MPERVKVLILWNNATRRSPNHNTFGIVQLENDDRFEVVLCPEAKYPWINRIGRSLDLYFLEEQIRAVMLAKKVDVLYAPSGVAFTKVLVVAKILGLLRKPLVILAPHQLFGRPSKWRLVRNIVKQLIIQFDIIVFLSRKMFTGLASSYEISNEYAAKHFRLIDWGVDSKYYQRFRNKATQRPPLLIASGATNRNFDLLVRIADRVEGTIRIYCTQNCYPKAADKARNIEVLCGEFPYEQICQDISAAQIVLIPLNSNQEGPTGITSLFEAMAIGTPVIISANENIDIDADVAGIGYVVRTANDEEWIAKINTLLPNSQLMQSMSDNGKRLSDEKYPIDYFVEELVHLLIELRQQQNN